MSAKRRQEAIARFAVPLGPVVTAENEVFPRVRALRRARNGTAREHDGDDENDGDNDFVMDGTNHDSDDEFADDPQFSFSQKKKRTKGKGRAPIQDFDPSEGNPRVMLLSLKAVSCDLENDDV